MNNISAISKSSVKTLVNTKLKFKQPNKEPQENYYTNLLKKYAGIIDSRESTYRLALDLSAFDIPTLGAAAFRNFWNFLEAGWEAGIGTIMVFMAPRITKWVGKFVGLFILDKKEQKDGENYLRFAMGELENTETMKQGIERIKKEEPKDQKRISELYKGIGNENLACRFEERAKNIERFCSYFKPKESNREKIYKLKRLVILGESLIEGGVWGGFGLSLRWFRKYILRKERFTGTMGYLGDSESATLGEGGELNLFQKVGGTAAIFLSPVINTILMSKTKDKNNVQKSRFLSVVNNHLDMTHGIYPKLGLLFTYTSVPKWTGLFITSQGWYERIERVFKFLTIIPSWWLGHRITNGLLAKHGDKKLSEKYNANKGILVEPEYIKPDEESNHDFLDKLKYLFPEPARIHHVLESVEKSNVKNKSKLLQEAKDLHAKCLYTGFALHSFLVWVVTMLVNYSTKWRTERALNR